MADTTDVLKPPPDPRDLRAVELETQLRQRDARIEQLQQRIAELEQQLAELKRAAKRQATPFARKRRKEKPQRPGRKDGQGPFTARGRPTPDPVPETKEQALDACPPYGGPGTDGYGHRKTGR